MVKTIRWNTDEKCYMRNEAVTACTHESMLGKKTRKQHVCASSYNVKWRTQCHLWSIFVAPPQKKNVIRSLELIYIYKEWETEEQKLTTIMKQADECRMYIIL